jgi:hypothetical protein
VAALRIQGLVRVANRVRRELSQPTSAGRRQELREFVTDSLRQVDRILAAHATPLENLPPPTQRAYRFLAALDFDATTLPGGLTEAPPDTSPAAGNVSLVRLAAFWQRLLDRLAQPPMVGDEDDPYESLSSANKNIERYLQDQGLDPCQLTQQSRAVRRWLVFFAERENFDAYISAVRLASPILSAVMVAGPRFRAPLRVHFRPMSGLFRVRGAHDGTRVALPTPMITFDAQLFTDLAELIFRHGNTKQPVLEATAAEAYQDILAELDVLAGVPEQAQGVFHDLSTAFERVRQSHFDGTINRPRLAWSRTFTGRKFGHYDRITDTVMISCSLDRADVPAIALDFVMYHELLHKKLGVSWSGGRARAHTPEYRFKSNPPRISGNQAMSSGAPTSPSRASVSPGTASRCAGAGCSSSDRGVTRTGGRRSCSARLRSRESAIRCRKYSRSNTRASKTNRERTSRPQRRQT